MNLQTIVVVIWAPSVPRGIDREASFKFPDRFDPAIIPQLEFFKLMFNKANGILI